RMRPPAVTAGGRILDLALLTLGVVIGIVAGLSAARALGMGFVVSSEPPELGPLPLQFAGVAVVAVTVAIWNGAGVRTIVVSAVLGGIAWLGFTGAMAGGLDTAIASGLG